MCNFPIRRCCCPSAPFSLRSIVIVKIACERDDAAFMLVAPTDPKIVEWPLLLGYNLNIEAKKKSKFTTGGFVLFLLKS